MAEKHRMSSLQVKKITSPIKFKSYVPNIKTRKDINYVLYFAFCHQYMLDRRTSPWESQLWSKEELDKIEIKTEKVERLYHVVVNDEFPDYHSWEIFCQIEYRGKKYFVEMYANCSYSLNCTGGGVITITKYPGFYVRSMVANLHVADRIYIALREDGHKIAAPDLFSKIPPKFWTNVPTLQHLCKRSIHRNKEKLFHYKDELPSVLSREVEVYIVEKEWELKARIVKCD